MSGSVDWRQAIVVLPLGMPDWDATESTQVGDGMVNGLRVTGSDHFSPMVVASRVLRAVSAIDGTPLLTKAGE